MVGLGSSVTKETSFSADFGLCSETRKGRQEPGEERAQPAHLGTKQTAKDGYLRSQTSLCCSEHGPDPGGSSARERSETLSYATGFQARV